MAFASTTYIIYVALNIGFETGVLGVLFALGSMGSLVGSWLTARIAQGVDARAWLVGSLALWAVGSVATPLATTAALAAVLIATQQIVGDAGGMAYGIADRTLRQARAARSC